MTDNSATQGAGRISPQCPGRNRAPQALRAGAVTLAWISGAARRAGAAPPQWPRDRTWNRTLRTDALHPGIPLISTRSRTAPGVRRRGHRQPGATGRSQGPERGRSTARSIPLGTGHQQVRKLLSARCGLSGALLLPAVTMIFHQQARAPQLRRQQEARTGVSSRSTIRSRHRCCGRTGSVATSTAGGQHFRLLVPAVASRNRLRGLLPRCP